MQLLEQGPSITVLTEDKKFLKEVESIHENMFKTVPLNIYHNDGPVQEEHLAWTLSVMRLSDNIFIDLDSVNEIGLIASLIVNSNLVFISQTNKRSAIVKMFNSMTEGHTIYESPEEYLQFTLNSFVN